MDYDPTDLGTISTCTARILTFEDVRLIELPGQEGIFSGVVDVDAELAERLLAYNSAPGERTNRKMRETRVQNLYRTLTGGGWMLNGEAVCFDWLAILRNGQHRLESITRTAGTGKSFRTVITVGLDPVSQMTMDQGYRREAHEQLAIAGIDAGTATAAAIRLLIRWDTRLLFGDVAKRSCVASETIVMWAKNHPEAMDYFRQALTRGRRRITGTPPSVALAAAYQLSVCDADAAEEFIGGLIDHFGLAKGSPVRALWEKLDLFQRTSRRVSQEDVLGYYFLAWNAFREGHTLRKLQAPAGGFNAENFPEPK